MADLINITIARSDTESQDASELAHHLLAEYMCDQATIVANRERLNFAWDGYDRDPRELFEIPEVVAYIEDLNKRWPYALYFLSREGHGLHAMYGCLTGARMVGAPKGRTAQIAIDPERRRDLLVNQWLPALAHMCHKAGYGEQAVTAMTDSALDYVTGKGKHRSVGVGEPNVTRPSPFVLGVGADIWSSGEAYDLVEALEAQTLSTTDKMRRFREGLELSWHGLDDRHLWEMPEAVQFALDLDRNWPYAFFFLSRDGYALRDLAGCIQASGTSIGEHAADVWLPALAHAVERAGLGEEAFEDLATSALSYFSKHFSS